MKNLPIDTVDRMCASQVVPNTHACIRELVENALDANASFISIRIRNSGMELEVADDGSGINEEDWPNLCKPHSTSKISKFDDLLEKSIASHGFRGEALASLCSLSNELRVITRTKDMTCGRILAYDSKCVLQMFEDRVSKSVGTTVTVVGLFENSIPVRFLENQKTFKKQLKSIVNLLHELAIIHPMKKMELIMDGNCIVSSPGGLSSCHDVYKRVLNGGTLCEFRIPKQDCISVSGWLSPPSPSGESHQFMYLNSRPINPIKRLAKSILSVYSKYSVKKVCWIILIEAEGPNLFDVNISVDKREILLVPEIEKLIMELMETQLAKIFTEKPVSSFPPLEFRPYKRERAEPMDVVPYTSNCSYLEEEMESRQDEETNCNLAIMELSLKIDKNMFMMMELIGQFNNGFIITKLNGEMFLVDQHAANERYLFEYYNDSIVVRPQVLIAPIQLKVNPIVEDIIFENQSGLHQAGFRIEYVPEQERGQRFRIVTLPTLSGIGFNRSAALSINDFMHIIDALDAETSLEAGNHALLRLLPSVKNLFASKACRTAVMVGDCLTEPKMMDIVRSLATLHQPWNCPHGRPTLKHLLSISDIEKMH